MIRKVFVFLLLGASLVLSGQTVLAASVQGSLSKDVDAGTPDSVNGPLITITSQPISKGPDYILRGTISTAAVTLTYSVNGGPEHSMRIANPFSQMIRLADRVSRIQLTARDAKGRIGNAGITVVHLVLPADIAGLAGDKQGAVSSQDQMEKLRQTLAASPPPANTSAASAQAGLAKMKNALADMNKALADAGVNTPSSESPEPAGGANKIPQHPAPADNAPPVLHILSGSVTSSTRYLLTGTVSDDSGISRMDYVVDGSQPFRMNAAQGYFSIPVVLKSGDNTIMVTATDTAGQETSGAINVRVSPTTNAAYTSPLTHRNPSDVMLSASETARALADPANAEKGIWSLLANLGIGVYTGNGDQVMPGSETDENDFWLYDFDVLPLAHMVFQPAGRISDLSIALNKWGFAIKPAQLVALYRDMFASQKDAFTARLFRIWHVPLGSNPHLTRLQAWLLLISILPANGSHSLLGSVTTHSSLYRFVQRSINTLIPEAQAKTTDSHPGKIHGNGASSNFAVAVQYLNAAKSGLQDGVFGTLKDRGGSIGELVALNSKIVKVAGIVGKIKDAATMIELYLYFEKSISVAPASVHMVHDTNYEEVGDKKVTITVTASYVGPKPGSINYGVVKRVKLGLPKAGPLKDAGVRFRLDDFLKKHGYWRDPNWTDRTRLLTDSKGKAVIQYETKKERPRIAQKMKTIAQGQGIVTAELDVAGAAHQFFNTFASVEILSDLFDLNTISAPIIVTWHVPPQEFNLKYTNPLGEIVKLHAFTCDGSMWQGKLLIKGKYGDADSVVDATGKLKMKVDHWKGDGTIVTEGIVASADGSVHTIDNTHIIMNIASDYRTAKVIITSHLDDKSIVYDSEGKVLHKTHFPLLPSYRAHYALLKNLSAMPEECK